jgi:ATP-dependent helicase/nuclease subunit B
LNRQILSNAVSAALAGGATLLVPSVQRQAAVRAAWSAVQRDQGRTLWATPRVLTFSQFCERALAEAWARRAEPDRLLPAGAEWALLRELRGAGGMAEARALLAAVRQLYEWRIPHSTAALAGSPEGERLLEALQLLEGYSRKLGRRPLRAWLGELKAAEHELLSAGLQGSPPLVQQTLRTLGARAATPGAATAAISIAAARDDDHELELIGAWCHARLEQDPGQRLLIVDARLRQRRRQYERVLSQTLSPAEWVHGNAREFSTLFVIEGGQPLTDFPLVAHALLTLRLLVGSLRFDELVLWLRMPFLDGNDLFAGAAIEAALRKGRKVEYTAPALLAFLERATGEAAAALAAGLREALASVDGQKRSPAEWATRLLNALRKLGWPGTRPLRSDELQTVARVQTLLDEYAALGAWLGRTDAASAVGTLSDLARERSFDPASVAAPVTLSDSHDDPVVHYDGIWVAGLDSSQWPPPPRPDAFIPLRLQVAAGVPAASAAGQVRVARNSFDTWRAATQSLVCSWAVLDGDAHRSVSPLLARLAADGEHSDFQSHERIPLARLVRHAQLEPFADTAGTAVNLTTPVRGGVKPLTLQAECGFHAYGEVRLGAERLEAPVPGIDPRERGMLLHKALELVWIKLGSWFNLHITDEQVRRPTIHQSVEAAVAYVYRGILPPELQPAVRRESFRLELLIESLLKREIARAPFTVDKLEARRDVDIAGGRFQLRIDRIDAIEGGGYAILDYKSGEPRSLRWDGEKFRDPQLLAYLLAEHGRDVQALANVSLTRGRARFVGKVSRSGLLPEVKGKSPARVPAEELDANWRAELEHWLQRLDRLAAAYLAGEAPVQPAPDVCRNCHLTVLCRRVDLAAADLNRAGDAHD